MKTLVVYYSRTGTTKKVGESIAKGLKTDSDEIIDIKKRAGVIGWIISGKDAAQKKLTDIKIKKDIEKYDRIIVGTPVWASNMAPAIRAYLTTNKFDKKNVNFFCTARGVGTVEAIAEMENLIPKSTVGGNLAVHSKEVKSGAYKEKVKLFVGTLK